MILRPALRPPLRDPMRAATALKEGGGVPPWFPLNRKWGFIGDSITNGSASSNAVYAFPYQSLYYAGTLHNPTSQRIVSGTPGNTSAQMLARAAADVPASSITGLVILAGTNDAADANAVSAATFGANITAIIALYPGKDIIVVTPPPRGSADTPSAGEIQRLIDYRAWIQANTSLGYRVADAYGALTDGADALDAAYDSGDGIHPNNLGHQKIADLVGAQMLASQTARTSMAAALVANSLISNPLFSGTLGGSPSGWFAGVGSGAATGSASTNTLVAAPVGASGQAYRMDITAAADSSRRRAASLSGFSVGDKLLIAGQVKVTAVSGDWSAISAAVTGNAVLRLTNGGSGVDLSTEPLVCAASPRQFAISYTVGAGVSNIVLQTQLAIPNGAHIQADFFEFIPINLTALGLASRILV